MQMNIEISENYNELKRINGRFLDFLNEKRNGLNIKKNKFNLRKHKKKMLCSC